MLASSGRLTSRGGEPASVGGDSSIAWGSARKGAILTVTPRCWGIVGVVALSFVVLGRIVFHEWLRFDDPLHVTDNPHLFPLTWSSLGHFWLESYEGLYIPLSYMLFAAECVTSHVLAGPGGSAPVHPAPFHAVSLFLHAGVVLAVYRLLLRIATPWAATAGAAVFAIHPLQVESVAWISEQRGLLAAWLAFASIERLLACDAAGPPRGSVRWRYASATLLFVGALLAKPVAVTAPLLALAWRRHQPAATWRVAIMPLVPWLVLAVIAVAATRAAQPEALNDFVTPIVCRPLLAGDALAFYARRILVPADLCVEYGRTPQAVLADPWAPVGAAIVAAFLAAVFLSPRFAAARLPTVLFVIPLLPVLGFTTYAFQNHANVADRYAYMAMAGPAAGLAWLMDHSTGRVTALRLHRLAITGYVALLAVVASRQASTWCDTGSLAEQAIAVAPRVPHSWAMLATHCIEAGEGDAAVRCARRALDLAPTFPRGMILLGTGLAASGRFPEAEAAFAAAERLVSDGQERIELGLNRGRMLLDARRDRDAATVYSAVLSVRPGHVGARVGLAIALTRTNETGRAADLLRGVIEERPDNAHAWVGLGNARLIEGAPHEAAAHYSRALSLDPTDAGTLVNRARASLAAGDRVTARRDARRAKSLGHPIDEELANALDDHTDAADAVEQR